MYIFLRIGIKSSVSYSLQLINTRSCNYSCTSSWWRVSPPETCRAAYRNVINWISRILLDSYKISVCILCAYWLVHACGLNRFAACMYVYRSDCGHVCTLWFAVAICLILSEWWSQGGWDGGGMWNVWGGRQMQHRLLGGKLLGGIGLSWENNFKMYLNPSAWGHLNPSSYCDVGRLFYRVFKLWSKLQRKKWRNNF